jgi:D-sedoheptulose 7-phosphate isomerase
MNYYKKKIQKYFKDYKNIFYPTKEIISNMLKFIDLLNINYLNNKKVIIFGNGGSSYIAGHFSLDLTNKSKIRCVNFNDPGLITCFANDYGYENWIIKALEAYGNRDDILVLISSKGESLNMLNACKYAEKKKFSSIITFTGFSNKNSLSKFSDINFWVNSKNYNHIENTHQLWLLSITDFLSKKIIHNPL